MRALCAEGQHAVKKDTSGDRPVYFRLRSATEHPRRNRTANGHAAVRAGRQAWRRSRKPQPRIARVRPRRASSAAPAAGPAPLAARSRQISRRRRPSGVALQQPPRSVWDRIERGYALAPMDNDLVREWENWYASRPDYVARMIERSSHFLFHIVEQVEKRGMPMEVALLPMIESAYNPVAYSRAHASGIWQFIPSTGKDFGLRQNWWYDGRRDVLAATEAALDYLEKLLRHVRRLAARARLVQLGRRRGRPRDGAQPRERPADRLREPHDAGRDAQLHPEADRGQEHHLRIPRATACRSPTSRTSPTSRRSRSSGTST